MAAFDFGVVSGTMLFAMSEDALDQISDDMYDDTDWYWDPEREIIEKNPFSRKRAIMPFPLFGVAKRRRGEPPRQTGRAARLR